MTQPLTHDSFPPAPGLEGIVAADTELSDVDGQNGQLVLRGERIEVLAANASFENAISHLWSGQIPLCAQELIASLAEGRRLASRTFPVMDAAPRSLGVMDLMRLGLGAIPLSGSVKDAALICGAQPVLMAAAARIKSGSQPIKPDLDLPIAQDLLKMLTGETPDQSAIHALERYLVTILDHGLNASTFTARVVASTQAGFHDAVIAAMGALKGPLHGGAPGPVLDMLDAIGDPNKAEEWIKQEITEGRRIMGFGHRIYRTRDPRADVLKGALALLPQDSPKLMLAEAVEHAALRVLSQTKPDRPLDTNVEYYTAVLLDAIGIDRTLFTPLFCVGRTPGWCAHIAEQRAKGKLIRPASRYIGPNPD